MKNTESPRGDPEYNDNPVTHNSALEKLKPAFYAAMLALLTFGSCALESKFPRSKESSNQKKKENSPLMPIPGPELYPNAFRSQP